MVSGQDNPSQKHYSYSIALRNSPKSRRDQAVGESISKSSKDHLQGGISPFGRTPASRSPAHSKSISKGSIWMSQKATKQESTPKANHIQQRRDPLRDQKLIRGKKEQQSDNMYINIEKLPGIPLKYELESQE